MKQVNQRLKFETRYARSHREGGPGSKLLRAHTLSAESLGGKQSKVISLQCVLEDTMSCKVGVMHKFLYTKSSVTLRKVTKKPLCTKVFSKLLTKSYVMYVVNVTIIFYPFLKKSKTIFCKQAVFTLHSRPKIPSLIHDITSDIMT